MKIEIIFYPASNSTIILLSKNMIFNLNEKALLYFTYDESFSCLFKYYYLVWIEKWMEISKSEND
jgi:hypothetical protein